MKHLGYIIALLVVMLVPAACTDSNNYVYNDVNAPAMLSFGFYKADNPGVLGSDYVVELTADQTGGAATQTVSVALPPTVEKDNLVARFTTSEGTTVKVGGAEQVSQTTANDFSQPIDYILTRGSVSRRCEVTVTKASLRWVETAQVAGITTYGNPVLKISPVDQKPYIGFKTRAGNSATAANHSTVLTWATTASGQPWAAKVSATLSTLLTSTSTSPPTAHSMWLMPTSRPPCSRTV